MPDKTQAMKELITRNAEEICRLHGRIHETMRHRDKSAEQEERWQRACKEFHSRYDKLAFPGGYGTAFDRILAGDAEAIEAGLCFLELRPYFFRSGYMYKALLPKFRRAPLLPPEAERLQAILVAYVRWRNTMRSGRIASRIGYAALSTGDLESRAKGRKNAL